MAKTTAPNRRLDTGVLSLKVTLRDTRPPIWRRILMPDNMTLADLHTAIQVTMGWGDSHLHDFDLGGQRYGDPSTTDDVAAEHRLKLSALAKSAITRFVYTYDFGDSWEHEILIEKAPAKGDAATYPACVAGKRNCPPEDCGGTWGYAELLEVLADAAHPQHDEQLQWLGGAYDAEAFSVPAANTALAEAFGRKQPPRS